MFEHIYIFFNPTKQYKVIIANASLTISPALFKVAGKNSHNRLSTFENEFDYHILVLTHLCNVIKEHQWPPQLLVECMKHYVLFVLS